MDFSTPDITAVSKPNRKPPNDRISDHPKTLVFFLFIVAS
jgi:hypothetical protein